jgi:hypothetical protein
VVGCVFHSAVHKGSEELTLWLQAFGVTTRSFPGLQLEDFCETAINVLGPPSGCSFTSMVSAHHGSRKVFLVNRKVNATVTTIPHINSLTALEGR